MKFIGRFVSFPIGLVLIAVGIIIFVVVNHTLNDEFEKAAVVIPDNGADEIVDPWIRFIGNENDPNNKRVYTFYVFNCTNPVETLKGELPKYEELGPYNYNYVYERINYNLTDSDEKLNFQLWKRYTPILTNDSRNPNTDVIYHFNLAYPAVINQVGKESTLTIVLAAGLVSKVIPVLESSAFLQLAKPQATPLVLGQSFLKALSTFGNDPVVTCQNLLNNGSINYSFRALTGQEPPSTFTVTQCLGLFTTQGNGNTPVYSFIDPLSVTAFSSGSQSIANAFGLDAATFEYVLAYWGSASTNYVPQALLYSVPECAANVSACNANDLGLYQWGVAGGIFGGKSIAELTTLVPVKPEFGILTNTTLSLAQIKFITSTASQINLVTPTGMGAIATLDVATLNAALQGAFTTDQIIALKTYVGKIVSTYSAATITGFLKNFSGGPITKHTVNDMLFDAVDPLLAIVKQGESVYEQMSSPLQNIPTKTEASSVLHHDSIYTGVGDISKVSAPVTFEGLTTLTYAKQIPVSGSFAEQLPPNYLFNDIDADVNIFTEEYARSLSFYKELGGDFSGIPYYRYRIKEENWEPNSDYFQSIPYLMNLTSVKDGAPAFLSRPRMKGIAPGYFYKAGVESLVNDDTDLDVFADYEPRSGKAIHGRYSLQVNGYVTGVDGQNSTQYDTFTALRSDVVHPMFWGINVIAATDDQVDILTKAYKVDSVRYALCVILIVVGGFLSLVSAGLFVLDIFEKKGMF